MFVLLVSLYIKNLFHFTIALDVRSVCELQQCIYTILALHTMEDHLNTKSDSTQVNFSSEDIHLLRRELKQKQKALMKRHELLKKQLQTRIASRNLAKKFTTNKNKTTLNTDRQKGMKAQKVSLALEKQRRRLLETVYRNRVAYSYKNRISLGGLKYVLIHGGNTLALVSSENESTKHKLTSIDDLELWIVYMHKKYVKDYFGNYNLQEKDHLYNNTKGECVYYTRNGYCQNLRCKYKHTPGHVALCPNIMSTQHECNNNHCHLSHEPSQFNAPSCKFFQEGKCSNVNCVFSHKLEAGADTPVCRPFAINGYCDLGRKCPYRHVFDCPDMQEYGYCMRGSTCHLNHSFSVKKNGNNDKGRRKAIRNSDNDEVVTYIDDNRSKSSKFIVADQELLKRKVSNTSGSEDIISESGYLPQSGDEDKQLSGNKDFVHV